VFPSKFEKIPSTQKNSEPIFSYISKSKQVTPKTMPDSASAPQITSKNNLTN